MKRFIIVYILLIIFFIGAFVVFGSLVTPSDTHTKVSFTVEKGEGVSDIARNLADRGLISSRPLFVLYALLSGDASRFQSGVYTIEPDMGTLDIASWLTQNPGEVEVIVYPGMTLSEIDERLSGEGVIKAGALLSFDKTTLQDDYLFLKGAPSLEGYLMPDTYRFYVGSTPKKAITTMLNNFEEKTQALNISDGDSERIITIASLIEKEVHIIKDKPLVASVIYNRLSLGMPLQIDAAVRYGVCGGRFTQCDALSRDDFSQDTPYNTYLYKGLPPTPISNPSVSSIQAALRPTKTSFLYYLSDPKTGETFFSTTLEEHNDKRAKYLGL